MGIRNVKSLLLANRGESEYYLAIAGSKAASGLKRDFIKYYHTNVQELGKKKLSFVDVEPLITVLSEVTDYDRLRIVANQWESVVASRIVHRLLPNPKNIIYGCIIENQAVELAARMNSMDNATNNAGDMHNNLSLLYNRTRQAGITTELSEIIAGAAPVQEQD